MFWGMSPALNLLQEYEHILNEDLPDQIDIMLVGSGDCRHIISTLAKRFQHKKVTLNFFIVEACIEMIARQLLLLNITLQPDNSLGLEQKTKIFMELYGNTLLRQSAAKYLSATAEELLKMITNLNYFQQKMPYIEMKIKYKERDCLENIFKFWCSNTDFNILEYWDSHVRKFLGVRYDSKVGAFDWDLHMRLHDIGGKQICNQEYRNFRKKGLAFSWMESEVSKPNRSLVCGVIPNGNTFAHHGYLGDTQTGPFIAFGLNCEDKEFLRSNHGQNAYRATDVTERNLKQVFYEIHNEINYVHSSKNMELGSLILKEEKLLIDVKGTDLLAGTVKKCINLKNVKFNFCSVSALDSMKRKINNADKFEVIYFGGPVLKYLDKQLLQKVSKNKTLLLVESELFVLPCRKNQTKEFTRKIYETLEGLQYEKVPPCSEQDLFVKFILNNNDLVGV